MQESYLVVGSYVSCLLSCLYLRAMSSARVAMWSECDQEIFVHTGIFNTIMRL